MTTQRKRVVARLGLTLFALPFIGADCGGPFLTNESACRAVINRTLTCVSTLVPVPPGTASDASQACATIPETPECNDWRALANCVASVPCDQFISNPDIIENCSEILTRLEINGCGPAGG